MKGKLSLLALLSTVVTVGGVYATWSFAEKEVSNANTTVNVAMTGLAATTAKGTLSVKVMGEGGFTLAVDDADNNHMPDIMKTSSLCSAPYISAVARLTHQMSARRPIS